MKRFLSFLSITVLVFLCACKPELEPEPAPVQVSLSVSTDNISFLETGGSQKMDVSSTYPWTASVDIPGVTISPSSGNPGKTTVTVTAEETSSADTVSGKIVFRSESVTASVNITRRPSALLRSRPIVEKIYEALDARNWSDPWIPGETWPGLSYDEHVDKILLSFDALGLKGEIPECIGDLGDMIYHLSIKNEPDVVGSLPESLSKLVALRNFGISKTSIQNVPDVFSEMPLESVTIWSNQQLSCQLPYSIGNSPALRNLYLHSNRFTGELPASWARIMKFRIEDNCLTGIIPKSFIEKSDFNIHDFYQKQGYGFDVTDLDIPGEWGKTWYEGEIYDLEGNTFTFDDVVKNNKCTVFINWAPWCPFSKELMPQLRDYYAKYHQDGLEVIATVMFDEHDKRWRDESGQRREIDEKGYGQWYNIFWDPEVFNSYVMSTPSAEVYDSDGLVQFSGFHSYIDPVRKRYGRTASTDLIAFLETHFGPAEEKDDYASTDYSQDGKVMTLQEATVGKGIDIVFMGDGYTDKDMAAGGLYETLMTQAMEEFFAIEPYKTFRNRFNVYAVKVVSRNGWIGEGYTTALGTRFGSGTEVFGNYDKCYEYALMVPSITSRENLLVSVLANTRRTAGTAAMSVEGQTSVAFISSNGNDASLFGPALRHESGGHGFAFLGDEYVINSSAVPQSHKDDYEDKYTKYGWYSNVDFTNDPTKVKWSAFLSDDRYKDEVGVFEGALYATGAWRPSRNSMMNMNFEFFNAPSRWTIYKRIMELSGETASFEAFLEYDVVNRGKAVQSARPPLKAASQAHGFVPTAPLIVIP